MKFEKPIMNISVFDAEDIMTASGGTNSNIEQAKTDAMAALAENAQAVSILVTF